MTVDFSVIFEPTKTGFSVYVTDFPGCVATGPNLEVATYNIVEAIKGHIRELGEKRAEKVY
jgi:predicted RNase H-like HicB family nuclease